VSGDDSDARAKLAVVGVGGVLLATRSVVPAPAITAPASFARALATAAAVGIAAGRARPSVETDAAWKGPSLSARYNAFPSGHTAASTAFFATLALACWRIGVPFLVIPLLIAFSRTYAGAHFLSDVICASLIGLLSAYVVAQWLLSPIGNRKSEI